MIKKAKRAFNNWKAKRKDPKSIFPNTKHIVEYAFTSGGVDYYKFNDLYNIPWRRGMEAIHAYEELEMRCDKKYLQEHTKLVNEILHGNKITMAEWNRLNLINDQLRQRLEWVVVPDQVYKLAAVVYFDATEDPSEYEIGYAKQKIERWKTDDDAEAFFLTKPMQELIPFLKDFTGSFTVYSEIIERVDKAHWNNLYTKFLEIQESPSTE